MSWRCEVCGASYDREPETCDNCGHDGFLEVPDEAEATAAEADVTTTVWVCPSCGREHPKNSPPCSRCGASKLEMEEKRVADYDVGAATSYRDLVTPRYAVAVLAALAVGLLFVAGVTGLVHVPGISPPALALADVPGEAERADGLELAAVEAAYLERLNEARTAAGHPTLSGEGRLGDVATFYNQARVKEAVTGWTLDSDEAAIEVLRNRCRGSPTAFSFESVTVPALSSFGTAAEAGAAIADVSPVATRPLPDTGGATGVDVHVAPDGSTYVFQVVC